MKQNSYPNITSFNPTECISGKMMRCNRIVANIFRKYISPFKVTDSQMSLLFVLSKMGNINQKTLADMLRIEKSTLNRNLDRLFDRELILRTQTNSICLTTNGKNLIEDIIPEWEKAMDEIKEVLKSDGVNALDLMHARLL